MHSFQLLPELLRTDSHSSPKESNRGNRGIHLIANVTEVDGGSFKVILEGWTQYKDEYYPLLESKMIMMVGIVVIKVYPGIPSRINEAASDVLPGWWRASIEHQNPSDITYSLSAHLF